MTYHIIYLFFGIVDFESSKVFNFLSKGLRRVGLKGLMRNNGRSGSWFVLSVQRSQLQCCRLQAMMVPLMTSNEAFKTSSSMLELRVLA